MTQQNRSTFEPGAQNERDKDLADTKRRLDDLEWEVDHVDLTTDIFGLFETVSTAPTNAPKGPYDQVKIYVNGATYRLYWYDGTANVWHYVTATA